MTQWLHENIGIKYFQHTLMERKTVCVCLLSSSDDGGQAIACRAAILCSSRCAAADVVPVAS